MAEILSLQEKLKAIDGLATAVNKQAGKTVIGRLGVNPELQEQLKINFIPTPSQNVNDAMGGGYPRKRLTIVAGMPDSGKTFQLLETIGLEMKRNPNFIAAWLESEGSLELKSMSEMFGIDLGRFVYETHDRVGAGEAALDRVEALLATGAIDMFVINSLKCLVPSEEFKKQMGDVQVGAQARMNAKMTRKLTSIINENNTAFVVVQHLTTQIGTMSRDPMIVAGGNAIIYAAGIVLDLRKQSLLDTDPITREEGVKIGVTIKKNHVVTTRNPYLKTSYYAIFGQGTERYLEALENAVSQSILTKTGAWIKDIDSVTGEPKEINGVKYAWCGKAAFREFCDNNPEYFEQLLTRISGDVKQLEAEEIEKIESERKAIEDTLDEDVIAEVNNSTKKSKKK